MASIEFYSLLYDIRAVCSTSADAGTILKSVSALPPEYLYILKQDVLLKVYSSLSSLPGPMLRGNVRTAKTRLEQEIVRRYLTAYPKKFTPLREFLVEYDFEDDPLAGVYFDGVWN